MAEKAPELATAAVAAGGHPLLLPLAVVARPVIDHFLESYQKRPDPHALPELYRTSLLATLVTCVKPLRNGPDLTGEDKALIDLWEQSLSIPIDQDRRWAALLDEEIPDATARMISLDLSNPASYWPLLRAQLDQWTDWFRYRRIASSAGA